MFGGFFIFYFADSIGSVINTKDGGENKKKRFHRSDVLNVWNG
jgi:hypothetical protein